MIYDGLSSSSDITKTNVSNIRYQITRKNKLDPYLATIKESKEVITDFDTFPYPRWYRGLPEYDNPIIAEREAGWRINTTDCYKKNIEKIPIDYPTHCFQAPCSYVHPCYLSFETKYNNREKMDTLLNQICTIQYR